MQKTTFFIDLSLIICKAIDLFADLMSCVNCSCPQCSDAYVRTHQAADVRSQSFVHTIQKMAIDDIDVEWDESKRQTNRRKHGVDFADVVECFYDPFSKVMLDPDHHDEHRYVLVGEDVHGCLLVVVYSQPDTSTIRIISARTASTAERRTYMQR